MMIRRYEEEAKKEKSQNESKEKTMPFEEKKLEAVDTNPNDRV